MADSQRELEIIVRARDLASKALKGINKELGKTGKIASRSASHAAKTLATLGTVAAGVAAAGLLASVKAAADFESQLNTINTVARRTPEELAAIGQGIRQIARDTGAPLEELTQGFYDLVSAGVAANQAQQVLASSNRLAIGGLATAAEGVDLITTALNSYGVAAKDQGKESERFADIFAKAIERGKVTAAELAASFAQVGPLAASMGVSIEELAAGYAQLTAKGVPAAEASTQMKAALIALVRTTGPLEKLQKQTGRNYAAIASKKGLVAAFEQLRKDAKKAGVPLIELVGRQEALQFALGTTGTSLDEYIANLAAMNNAQNTAAEQMSERSQGLNYNLARLKALALDAGITIGDKLLPKLTPLFQKAVDFLNTNQGGIERFGTDIAKAFEKAASWASKVPWGAIGAGLRTGAQFAASIVDTFARMPKEVQGTLLALAGLNKLSGGGVIDFGKLAFEQVFSRGASPANPLWVAQVGGGLTPGVPGAKGPTSNLGKGLDLLAKIAVVGLVAELADLIHEQIKPSTPPPASELSWPWGPKNTPTIMADIFGGNGLLGGDPAAQSRNRDDRAEVRQEQALGRIAAVQRERIRQAQTLAMTAHRQGERQFQTAAQLKTAVDASKTRLASEQAATRRETTRGFNAEVAATNRSAAAIRAKKLAVTIRNINNVNISIRDVARRLSFSQNMAVYG